jgi:hypothetical protein
VGRRPAARAHAPATIAQTLGGPRTQGRRLGRASGTRPSAPSSTRRTVVSIEHLSVRSAVPGQPYPQDIEQRNTAARLAAQAVRGSVEEHFYRALSQSAETWIDRTNSHDVGLPTDGRDWPAPPTSASPTPSAPPSPSPALAMKATPTASRQPEVAGQQPGADAERSLYRSCGRLAHRSCPRRPCPSVDSALSEPGMHGRIADDGGPQSSLDVHTYWSAGGGASGL